MSGCELPGDLLRPGVLELSPVLILPTGEGVEMLGLSLEIKNNWSKSIYIRHIELWLLSAEGELWPSRERAAKTLEVEQSIASGESKKTLFTLNELASDQVIPPGLGIKIIRVNGYPYRP